MRRRYFRVVAVVAMWLAPVLVFAQGTDSPAPPDDPSSAMPTLGDLYDRLATGADYELRTTFVEPAAGPGPTGHTLQQVMDQAPEADDAAGALPADVVSGATYWGLRTDGGGWGPQTGARAPAAVAETGQTICYDPNGVEIDCTGTGQDGDIQAGVAWPNPRFTDNDNGTVTDNLTGLIWLKDASCADLAGTDANGAGSWTTALSAAAALAHGTCGLTDGSSAGDWRLPNARELHSLVDFEYYGPPLSNTAGTAHWTEGDPFSGVVPNLYWTSSTHTYSPNYAHYVDFYGGYIYPTYKVTSWWVWPVRGGE